MTTQLFPLESILFFNLKKFFMKISKIQNFTPLAKEETTKIYGGGPTLPGTKCKTCTGDPIIDDFGEGEF